MLHPSGSGAGAVAAAGGQRAARVVLLPRGVLQSRDCRDLVSLGRAVRRVHGRLSRARAAAPSGVLVLEVSDCSPSSFGKAGAHRPG